MGEPFIITHPDEAASKAEKFRELIQSPVLTNIEIDFGKFDVFDVAPPPQSRMSWPIAQLLFSENIAAGPTAKSYYRG